MLLNQLIYLISYVSCVQKFTIRCLLFPNFLPEFAHGTTLCQQENEWIFFLNQWLTKTYLHRPGHGRFKKKTESYKLISCLFCLYDKRQWYGVLSCMPRSYKNLDYSYICNFHMLYYCVYSIALLWHAR